MSTKTFEKYVSGLEQRYRRNESDEEDYSVDITTMNIDTLRPRTRLHSTLTAMEMERRISNAERPHCSKSIVKYIRPSCVNADEMHLNMYRPPSTSSLFDRDYQVSSLKQLLEILEKDESGCLKKPLIEAALKLLGLTSLPYAPTVQPIFHVNEKGIPDVSFLYARSLSTPWMSFLELLYPVEVLQLSKRIYKCILTPDLEFAQRSERAQLQSENLDSFEETSSENEISIMRERSPAIRGQYPRRVANKRSFVDDSSESSADFTSTFAKKRYASTAGPRKTFSRETNDPKPKRKYTRGANKRSSLVDEASDSSANITSTPVNKSYASTAGPRKTISRETNDPKPKRRYTRRVVVDGSESSSNVGLPATMKSNASSTAASRKANGPKPKQNVSKLVVLKSTNRPKRTPKPKLL